MAREVAIWVSLVAIAILLAVAGGRRSAEANRPPEVPGHLAVGFGALGGYDYVTPEVGTRADTGQIPADVLALNDSDVLVRGFVLPLETDRGRVYQFYLARYPLGCCFGRPVAANELIHVDLKDPVPYRPHRPLWLRGRLEVGERYDAAGYLESVYRLVGGALVRIEERATPHEQAASSIPLGSAPTGLAPAPTGLAPTQTGLAPDVPPRLPLGPGSIGDRSEEAPSETPIADPSPDSVSGEGRP